LNADELTTVAAQLTQAFDPATLTRLGREQGFCERERDITPARLGLALVAAFASQKLETLADLQRCFNALHGATVTYKPFYNQLLKPTFPQWMQAVVKQLLQHLVLQVLAPPTDASLALFTDILIQDSSGLKVHDALQEKFPGRYPVKSPAVVELHTTLSVAQDQAVRLSLTGQRADPRDELPKAKQLTGRLLLADRGYQAAEYCRQVGAAGGFFLIRCTQKVNPCIRRCWVGGQRRPEWEGKKVKEVLPWLTGQSADLEVEFPRGQKRPHPVRLRLLLGWNPTKDQHIYLATNLDRERFPIEQVLQLYRLRWQIELWFKECKSYGNLQEFGTAKDTITEGLVWAALAATLVKRFLAHAAQVLASRRVAVSTRRAAMSLSHHLPDLWRALRDRNCTSLHRALRALCRFLQQDARRSNARRDTQQGRASFGLQPVRGLAA
jgi:hypothetical protein